MPVAKLDDDSIDVARPHGGDLGGRKAPPSPTPALVFTRPFFSLIPPLTLSLTRSREQSDRPTLFSQSLLLAFGLFSLVLVPWPLPFPPPFPPPSPVLLLSAPFPRLGPHPHLRRLRPTAAAGAAGGSRGQSRGTRGRRSVETTTGPCPCGRPVARPGRRRLLPASG